MKQENNNWEKELSKWYLENIGCDSNEVQLYNKFKSFISNLLEAQRQSLIKEIGERKRACNTKEVMEAADWEMCLAECHKENETLQDIINLLKGRKPIK